MVSSLVISLRSFFKRAVKHFIHQRAVDRVNRWIHIKRLRGLAAFLVTDDIAHTAADVVIHDEARIGAHARPGLKTLAVLLAAQRADDQEASALEHIHRLAQSHATDDGSE